jgi:hypothetical protein
MKLSLILSAVFLFITASTFAMTPAQENLLLSTPSTSINWNATLNPTLPVGVGVSRGSAANYYNSTGILTSAGINVPRFDYNPSTLMSNGLLLESAGTNLITYSNDFTQWTKSNAMTAANAWTSPDGTNDGQSLADNSSNSIHISYRSISGGPGTYTFSFYAKANTLGWVYAVISADSADRGAYFNLATGAVGNTIGGVSANNCQVLQNSAFRCSVTYTAITSVTALNFFTAKGNDTGRSGSNTTYVGSGQSMFLFGIDIKTGTYASSYVATGGGTATRSADVPTGPSGSANNTTVLTYTSLATGVTTTTTYSKGTFSWPTNVWIRNLVVYGSTPPFVNSSYGLDFNAMTAQTLDPSVNFSTTGLREYFDRTGKWTYSPNNLLLNSATLSTQSVTVLDRNHILSFQGTGTVTLSGASTAGPLVGTGANNRVYLAFTPTAASLTLTVSGSVTKAQLEVVTYQTTPSVYNATAGSQFHGARFAADPASLVSYGMVDEFSARTNIVLWNRDLTNAAWTMSNVTAAKDQTGIDGVANSASSLTATANGGTACQTITNASTARWLTAYVMRVTGTGAVSMSMDNGATYTAVSPGTMLSESRVAIPSQTLANPIVCFKFATSGDKIAVDEVDLENGTHGTSAITTTSASVTRPSEVVTLTGTPLALFADGDGTVSVDAYQIQTIGAGGIAGTILSASSDNTKQIMYAKNGNTLATYDGSVELSQSGATFTPNFVTAAIAWSSGGRALAYGYQAATSDGNVFIPDSVPSIWVGSRGGVDEPMDGNIVNISIFSNTLSNSALLGTATGSTAGGPQEVQDIGRSLSAWSPSEFEFYTQRDIVTYNGAYYFNINRILTASNASTPDVDTLHWQVLPTLTPTLVFDDDMSTQVGGFAGRTINGYTWTSSGVGAANEVVIADTPNYATSAGNSYFVMPGLPTPADVYARNSVTGGDLITIAIGGHSPTSIFSQMIHTDFTATSATPIYWGNGVAGGSLPYPKYSYGGTYTTPIGQTNVAVAKVRGKFIYFLWNGTLAAIACADIIPQIAGIADSIFVQNYSLILSNDRTYEVKVYH